MADAQAISVKVAEAVAREMDGQTFTLSPTIVRRYVVKTALSDLGVLHVDVVVGDLTSAMASRTKLVYASRVDVVVRKLFNENTEVDDDGLLDTLEIDRLILLVEEILKFFAGRRLSSYATATWKQGVFGPLYSPKDLHELRQFTGVVSLTYEVVA